MIGRLSGLRGTLSSHWLASSFAGAYLVLSLILGVTLLSMPKQSDAASAPAERIPTIVYEDSPTQAPLTGSDGSDDFPQSSSGTTAPTTKTKPPVPAAPAGYRQVTGPAGIKTVIPVSWRSARTTGPGAVQATDPADPVRYVKYGGSVAPGQDIASSHVRYENDFAARAVEYRRINLASASYGGHDAVIWEFEHRDGPNLVHVRSLYWRAGDKEYVILAAAPGERWPAMQSIYETMVANATP